MVLEGIGDSYTKQCIDLNQGPNRSPAIFASLAADMAIFHAIFNGRNFPDKMFFDRVQLVTTMVLLI